MTNTELKRSIDNAGLEAQYDEHAKKFLSHKIVLAWIMHSVLDEYKNIDPEVIAEKYIEHTEVGNVGVLPGGDTELVRGERTEDSTPREGRVTYDILFRALAPNGDDLVELILNVEAQNKYNPGYELEKRAIYYCSRMISNQYGREFQGSGYGKIKKVCSIWICTNPPKEYQNSIATYEIKERLDVGGKPRDKENYDLMVAIMIGLGKSDGKNYDGIIKLLSTLLSGTILPKEKEEILQNEFNMAMNDEMKEDVETMCNLSQGILQTGINRGIKQGIEQGIKQGIEQGIEQGVELGKAEGANAKAKDITLELYKLGLELEKIAKVTHVSVEQIQSWIRVR